MKKNLFLLFVILLITLLFFNCTVDQTKDEDNDDETPAKLYAIGDTGPSGVGKVFYITDGGLHGLEVAPSLWNGGVGDPTAQWKTSNTSTAGTLTAIGTGSANTAAMAGAAHPAAELCRAYTGGGKTNWFLPSIDELDAIWDNLVNNGSGGNSAVGSFANALYWSSSELSAGFARDQHFSNGSQSNLNKNGAILVRAIRAF